MFYEPRKKDHGLPHDPYNAIVAPRPIGWITSISSDGEINLAPYSFFNSVSSDPPMVMFASDGRKHTIDFIEQTGEFVCSLAVWHLRTHVKDTSLSFARGVNEMEAVGLEAAPSILVKPPRVKASPSAAKAAIHRAAFRKRNLRAHGLERDEFRLKPTVRHGRPAIHVFVLASHSRRGCPRQARA